MRSGGGLVLLLVLGLSACTHLDRQEADKPDPHLLEKVLSGEPVLGHHWRPEELPDYALFELTPDMKAFAEKATARHRRAYPRAEALHYALLLPTTQGGYGLRYNALVTAPPQEAFLRREINCVSFSLIYVAMARHLGLVANVNEVDIPPDWGLREEDAFLFMRHVNVQVRLGMGDNLIIDLEMERYSPGYTQRLISEDLVAAQFYSNRGMELSADGDHVQAFLHLRKALLQDDRQSYIWSNMATLYRRLGYLPEAEAAYLKGLVLDPRDQTIISNLGGLYRRMGQEEKSAQFLQRAQRHRDNNPYYLYNRARTELQNQQPEAARQLLTRAIRKRKDEPRFYQLGEAVYQALGDERTARRMADRAESLRAKILF